MTRVSQNIDRLDVTFDDPNLVSDAGLLLVATLTARLGLEALINDAVRLVGRIGGAHPGRKVLTLVHSMVRGGSHIDHADALRAGSTVGVLGHRVMAPSTLGTFLRSFTFGHVRQLDRVIAETIGRAWRLGAGPGDRPMTIDLDSTICEVHGKAKRGASYGYTKRLGYHPLLASRADTGEVLHCRLRRGAAASGRGVVQFARELVARVRNAGATGRLCVRADAGFYNWELVDVLSGHDVDWSITVIANKQVNAAISRIAEDAWVDIVYPDGGTAQVADTIYVTGANTRRERRVRMVVRRTRLIDPVQAELWPNWRHHAFVTNLTLDPVAADQFHRDHATVELAIRDLKEGAGLAHCPSGSFTANGAWLACAVLAHNIVRWTARLGEVHPDDQLTVTRTVRTRMIGIPGRLVNRSRHWTLRLPARWPWTNEFLAALKALRSLPLVT